MAQTELSKESKQGNLKTKPNYLMYILAKESCNIEPFWINRDDFNLNFCSKLFVLFWIDLNIIAFAVIYFYI